MLLLLSDARLRAARLRIMSIMLPDHYRTSASQVGSHYKNGPVLPPSPPSACYIPPGIGRTIGWNSRTLESPSNFTYG